MTTSREWKPRDTGHRWRVFAPLAYVVPIFCIPAFGAQSIVLWLLGAVLLGILVATPSFVYWNRVSRRMLRAERDSLTVVRATGRSESVQWDEVKQVTISRGAKRVEWSQLLPPPFPSLRIQMIDPWTNQPEWSVFAYSDYDFDRLTDFVSSTADEHAVRVTINR